MPYPQRLDSDTHDVLRQLTERRRLVTVVAMLTREVERLSEDNSQLRAAVTVYREVARKATVASR